MDVDKIFEEYLNYNGISKLYEHQKGGIDLIRQGKSILVCTPTTSGKSLIAYYGILINWAKGLKSIYIVPLKALAEEKGRELRFFEKYGIKIKVSTGDYEESGGFLKRFDVIVTTSEKADSLIRNSPDSFNNFGFIIIDEIHTLGSEGRGDTLEILTTKFLHTFGDVQLMAMSATVGNYEEIAGWINSEIVKSDFRPVPLKRYLIAGKDIYNEEGEYEGSISDFDSFVNNSLDKDGQTIVFESTRKSAESDAKNYVRKYRYPIKDTINTEGLNDIPGVSDIIEMLKNGVAYHHAGIVNEVRNLIEKLFLERKIKVLFATTTLAAGINLPARTVIIKSVYRYDGFFNDLIPNIEVQQMLGRAGRSKYDNIGYGYILVNKSNLTTAYNKYILGPIEDIESKINDDNLKKHILGLITSGLTKNEVETINFFKRTFFAIHKQNIEPMVKKGIRFLAENDFIKGKNILKATPFGRRTSELYIEPESALILRDSLEINDTEEILLRISSTPDILKVNVSSNEEDNYYHPEYDSSIVKLSRILYDWIDELPEEKIIDRYKIYPADLRNRVENAEWLAYSLYEIGKILHLSKKMHRELYYRIKYGIKPELIPLVGLPYIGRVRARRLYSEGFDLERIANSQPHELMKIQGIGEKLAEKIIEHARKIQNIY